VCYNTVKQLVDIDLANSLAKLQSFASTKDDEDEQVYFEDLELFFTVPGYDMELRVRVD
jgi:hypothetical protein